MQTIRELIDALEEAAADYGDETPVRIALQPSDHIVWLAASDGVSRDESPYAPRDAWEGGY